MKIRTDFVSNSSSSSFIVKLDGPIDDYSFEEFADKMQYQHPQSAIEELYARLQTERPFYGYRVLDWDLAQEFATEDNLIETID